MIPPAAITRHAWQQFVTRWIKTFGDLPRCPVAEFKRLSAMAQPEDIGYGAAVRLMDNGLIPARYYAVEGWRFVLNEQGTMLITVERILLKKKKRAQGKRPYWRK